MEKHDLFYSLLSYIAVLCSEFKKIYMDEDTGEIDAGSLEALKKGVNGAERRLIFQIRGI